jgi:LysR family hca operon transcriptional activator
VLGFVTGYEFDWLPAVMRILRDELPSTEIVILSLSSPDLADGLMRGKIDLAFLRQERNTPGILFTRLVDEPMIALMPAGHRLAAREAVTAEDIGGEQLVGVPHDKSPVLKVMVSRIGELKFARA